MAFVHIKLFYWMRLSIYVRKLILGLILALYPRELTSFMEWQENPNSRAAHSRTTRAFVVIRVVPLRAEAFFPYGVRHP